MGLRKFFGKREAWQIELAVFGLAALPLAAGLLLMPLMDYGYSATVSLRRYFRLPVDDVLFRMGFKNILLSMVTAAAVVMLFMFSLRFIVKRRLPYLSVLMRDGITYVLGYLCFLAAMPFVYAIYHSVFPVNYGFLVLSFLVYYTYQSQWLRVFWWLLCWLLFFLIWIGDRAVRCILEKRKAARAVG